MEAVPKLALYILAIVIFIILFSFFFGPGSGFNAVKKVFVGVKESVNVSIGASEVKGEKPVLPAEHKEAINLLKRTMEKMRSKKQCFQNYQITSGGSDQGRNGLPILGEKGTSIILEKAGNDLRMILLGGIGGKQEISRDVMNDISPCVISGVSKAPTIFKDRYTVPEDFYNTFLAADDHEENNYNPVNKILITYDGGENKISYNNGPLLDFEDGGFLYTPDGKNVCFFPTKDGDDTCDGDSNAEGLDDDCLGEAGDNDLISVPALLKAGELKWCQ